MNDDVTSTPEPTSTIAAEKPQKRSYLWLALLLLLTQLATVGYVFVLTEKQVPVANDIARKIQAASEQQQRDIATLNTQIIELQTAAENLQHALSELQNSPAVDVTTLEERLTQVESDIKRADRSLPSDDKIDSLIAIADDIEALQAKVTRSGKDSWRKIQILSSFEQLEQHVTNYQPYTKTLAAFRHASRQWTDSALWYEVLRPSQHEGIASPDALREEFTAARDAALAGDDTAPDSVWSSVKRNLLSLVTIRKTGNSHTGNDVESILARAEFALSQEDVQTALDEVRSLPASTRQLFKDFIRAAMAREHVLALMDTIRLAIDDMLDPAD